MTLSNLNHFWIKTQAELCLKGTFVKASFMLVTIFLHIYENPRRKNFINPTYSKNHKIINWNKKPQFLFTLLCGASKRFHLFEAPKRSVRIKKLCHFPPYSIGKTRVKIVFCWTSSLHHFHFLDNRDT